MCSGRGLAAGCGAREAVLGRAGQGASLHKTTATESLGVSRAQKAGAPQPRAAGLRLGEQRRPPHKV